MADPRERPSDDKPQEKQADLVENERRVEKEDYSRGRDKFTERRDVDGDGKQHEAE